MRKLSKRSNMPPVYSFKGLYWDKKGNRNFEDAIYALLPWEITEGQAYPDNTTEDPCLVDESHPLYATRKGWAAKNGVDDHEHLAAYTLWGDAARMLDDQLYLLLWSCLSGSVAERFWICAFTKRIMCACGCYGRHTFERVWDLVAWIFGVLLAQTWPAVRHDGVRFAKSLLPGDKWRASMAGKRFHFPSYLAQKRADWAWNKQALNVCGWVDTKLKRCCWK